MRIFRTIKRIIRILILPNREWALIDAESESIGLIIKYYAWPFIVLAALIKAGSVFIKFTNDVNLIQFKIPFSLTILLFYMIVPLFVIMVGGTLIGHLSKAIGGSGHKNGALRLVIYSYTPVFLTTLFMNAETHHQTFQYVGIIGIYAVVLFWLGMEPMLHVQQEKKLKLLIISAMLFAFLYFIMMFVTRLSINLLYPEGVVLFL